jgi:epsilon-lactone hydrolase
MPRFKSKVFNFLIVNRHLFRGKLRKEIFYPNTSIECFREQCENGVGKYAKIPMGIEVREATEAMDEIYRFIKEKIK